MILEKLVFVQFFTLKFVKDVLWTIEILFKNKGKSMEMGW
jgi:hypothetical protein